MAILEVAILFNMETMLESQFYETEDVLDRRIRNSLLQAISDLASEAFGEEMQSFSLGDYSIVFISHQLGALKAEDDIENTVQEEKITMYCIVNKNTDEKIVIKSMNDALFQFTNRYSMNDLYNRKLKKFRKFEKRLEKIFGDLILKSEDRFKSLF